MSVQNPYSQYRQSQIETTPKLKLIVMLYDGAIRFLQQSISSMVATDYEKKGALINKAIAILFHLTGTLDCVQGGQLSLNLASLYQYMTQRLVEANFHNDPKMVEEVIVHLRELRGAWNTVSIGAEEVAEPAPKRPNANRADLSLAA